ncbi:unnamed protein product [Heterobilharzia americana]|nr:unnamed protein product [Heterobilharzia americana]
MVNSIMILLVQHLTIYLVSCFYCILFLLYNFGQSTNFAPEDRLFFSVDNCERNLDIGNWCEWSPWSRCEALTCTRLRQRECGCPAPLNWTKATECKTVKPQNDYRVNNTIIKHTRHIRFTSDTKHECKIPVILEGTYYPDCFQPVQVSKVTTQVSNKMKSKNFFCSVNRTQIGLCSKQSNNSNYDTKGMREYDVGACDNWRIIHHWSMENLPMKLKYIYDSDSELGRKCTFEVDSYNPLCKYYTLYSEYTRSDYGQNCRFACAIHIQCKAIEFIVGVHCILAFHFDESVLQRSIGTVIQLKPNECHPDIKDEQIYPYTSAVSILRV